MTPAPDESSDWTVGGELLGAGRGQREDLERSGAEDSCIQRLRRMGCRCAVIGASRGGVAALERTLRALPDDLSVPVIVCLHLPADTSRGLLAIFDTCRPGRVSEAEDKTMPRPGHVYFAPPGYHLLIERDGLFSLSVDEKVHFARPSIDVLFESAAAAWGPTLLGVLLTGANADGTDGMRRIKDLGGLTVVQSPADAHCPIMPEAAIAATKIDLVLSLGEICTLLSALSPRDEAGGACGESEP